MHRENAGAGRDATVPSGDIFAYWCSASERSLVAWATGVWKDVVSKCDGWCESGNSYSPVFLSFANLSFVVQRNWDCLSLVSQHQAWSLVCRASLKRHSVIHLRKPRWALFIPLLDTYSLLLYREWHLVSYSLTKSTLSHQNEKVHNERWNDGLWPSS